MLWLRADAGVNGTAAPADGDAVTTWYDQSGNGNNCQQPTSGKKPLFKVNIQNGLPSVRCDGSDDFLSGTLTYAGDPITVFIAAKEVTLTTLPGLFNMVGAGKASDADNIQSFMTDKGSGVLRVFRNSLDTDEPVEPTTGENFLVSVQWDGTNEQTVLNGTEIAPTPQAGTFNIATYYIACRWNASATSRYANNDYYEILAYNSSLNAGQRNRINQYLNKKWRLY